MDGVCTLADLVFLFKIFQWVLLEVFLLAFGYFEIF